ncbi:hypothetical protein BACCIP111883_02005 [Sutcliffiella rhizosphaerae]|uniref:LIM zinc-binding domain-containing protein n=2 Tax=Sutcliffiella rhizosphaerae TaxID=2880967 RepID=A0ABN8ADS2_9BACI|nr:hypothetical protein BACCIP111883_02005 [Sutcliffiella rhizosphaerae]
MLVAIYCPVCRKRFERNDWVIVDGVNTVFHVGCYGEVVEPLTNECCFEEICDLVGVFITEDLVH